jgi:hypothetical protein
MYIRDELLTHQAYVREHPEDADEDIKLYNTHYTLRTEDNNSYIVESSRYIYGKRYSINTSAQLQTIEQLLKRIARISAFTNAIFIEFSDSPIKCIKDTNEYN